MKERKIRPQSRQKSASVLKEIISFRDTSEIIYLLSEAPSKDGAFFDVRLILVANVNKSIIYMG